MQAKLFGADLTLPAVAAGHDEHDGHHVIVLDTGERLSARAVVVATGVRWALLVIRGDDLGQDMSRYLADRIEQTPRVRVLLHSEVRALHGDHSLDAVEIEDLRTGVRHTEAAKALFVFIGSSPHARWLGVRVALDERGFVLTGAQTDGAGPRQLLETSRPSVFAAGDVRSGSVKRVAAAVGDGALAVRLVHEFLARG